MESRQLLICQNGDIRVIDAGIVPRGLALSNTGQDRLLCRLLSGLLKIDSALTLVRLPRRDDADDFFVIFFVLPICAPPKEGLQKQLQ